MCNVKNHIPRPFDASVVLPWECVGVEQLEFRHFFSPGQVMLGAHLGLHLASVVAWRFHQHQVPSFSKDPFQSSHGWSGWSTIWDLMLDRNSIVHSNGSRLFSAGRPLGTRKNSVHCLWFLCCCTQTLHRTPFGTSSYFTHVDVCFGLLITALLCKFRIDINQLI